MLQVDLNRRAFLRTAPKLAVAAASLANISKLSAGPQLFNPSNPLSGVIRSPVNYLPVSQRFPAPLNFSSSRPIYPSPGFFYGGFISSFNRPYLLPYLRRNQRAAFNPYNKNYSNSDPRPESSNSGAIAESRFTYPISKTPQEQAALETLYKDTANSLAQNFGYYESFKNGELINTDKHLLHYLTPIVFAHDTYNQETLDAIEQGLKDGNKQLLETYGSLKFFKDAMAALEFNKIKSDSNPSIEDLNRIIRELKSIEAKTKARLEKESGAESKFRIGKLEENAAFIIKAYHRLNNDKLSMIADGLAKATNQDEKVWKSVTPEQRLYAEQFTTEGTREIIGQPLFLLLINILNNMHSEDRDSSGNKLPKKIPELIKKATASNSNSRLRAELLAGLS